MMRRDAASAKDIILCAISPSYLEHVERWRISHSMHAMTVLITNVSAHDQGIYHI